MSYELNQDFMIGKMVGIFVKGLYKNEHFIGAEYAITCY